MRVLGIDVGGTFTDLILVDTNTGEETIHKLATTPSQQEKSVIQGIEELLNRISMSPSEIDIIIHGTTVATNAMIERKGARVCLVTTRGIEDVLEIGRQNREEIYDLFARRPGPLVARQNRVGVDERINWRGNVVVPLETREVSRVIDSLKKMNPEAVAISLLFSFMNPKHEKQLAKGIRGSLRSYVAVSYEVLPEYREFERTSTTVLEAYLGPVILGYLERLDQSLTKIAPAARLNVMQSNGGTVRCSNISGRTIGLAISGLAGGVIGGWETARQNDIKKALTLDMGGTSCDISALHGGIKVRPDNEIAGFPLRFPSVDVKTIGAGGGSIAWIDDAEILHVGPQSAGAVPGPVSYGLGGTEPTVTDANLVMGRLSPGYFAGGSIALDDDLAKRAIHNIGKRLGLSKRNTALGIIKISTANMVQAIREITIEKGMDPREFTLIPFGGAGPTQAVDIAESLGIGQILIPRYPGITSAMGLVHADLRVDMMRSVMLKATENDQRLLLSTFESLIKDAQQALIEQGADEKNIHIQQEVDMRYQGQSHEIPIDIPPHITGYPEVTRNLFETEHKNRFGYLLKDREIEWVTARVVALATDSRANAEAPAIFEFTESDEREVIMPDGEVIPVQIYRRVSIPIDRQMKGPLIIEQVDTTTWVGQGWSLKRTRSDVLWLRRGGH